MANIEMKTLTIGDQTFEIVDEVARKSAIAMSVYENHEFPLSFTTGKLRYLNGDEFEIAIGIYGETTVNAGNKIDITGFQWAASGVPLYIFYDANDNVVASYTHSVNTVSVKLTDVEVPIGAVKILVNGNTSNSTIPQVMGEYTKIHTAQEMLDKTMELEAADKAIYDYVDAAVNVQRVIENYEYPVTVYDGKLIQRGTIVAFESGSYGETSVIAGTKLTITGKQWGASYGYNLYYFMNDNNEVIEQYAYPVDGTNPAVVEATVPVGATKLWVNANTTKSSFNLSVVGEYLTTIGIADLAKEIEALEKPEAEVYKPKLITLGDSITALGTGERGWVKYFIEKTGCTLIANTAVNGAWLMDKEGTVYNGNPVFDGADANVNNVLGNQVQKIINNAYEAPDIIMIAIGTNGGISITKEQIRAAYYDSNNALIPLANVDRTTSAGAYRWCLEKLHETYPNAIIFWCTPIMGCQTIRSADNAMNYAESLRIATEYTGQIMIDTIRCGINGVNEVSGTNGQYLIDGLHPNVNGAKKIGYYNASKVMPFLGNNFELG